MKRRLTISISSPTPASEPTPAHEPVDGPDLISPLTTPRLIAELPPELRRYQVGWELVVPLAELDAAREIVCFAHTRGWRTHIGGEAEWEPSDAGADRPVILDLPRGPACDEDDFVVRASCPKCGQLSYQLAESPRLDVGMYRPAAHASAAMATRSGLAILLTAAAAARLDADAMLRAGQLLPVHSGPALVPGLLALVGTLDLGRFIDDEFTGYCPTCGAPTGGGGFIRMLPRPAQPADVYATAWFGPTVPLVSERLARALDRLNDLPDDRQLTYYGWWPDDASLSLLPDLTLPASADHDDGAPAVAAAVPNAPPSGRLPG